MLMKGLRFMGVHGCTVRCGVCVVFPVTSSSRFFRGQHRVPRILFFGGDAVSASVLGHLCVTLDRWEIEVRKDAGDASKLLTPLAAASLEQVRSEPLRHACLEVVCPPTTHDSSSPLHALCRERGIKMHPVNHPKSLKKAGFVLPHTRGDGAGGSSDFDVALVVSFRYFIPDDLLKAMPRCINVHPSLLPKYRGASPIFSTMRNNESDGGVSIIKIVPGELMDCGDILAQEVISIAATEDIRSYQPRVLATAAEMVDAVLFGGCFDHLWDHARVQERKCSMRTDPTHAPLLGKHDSALCWSTMSATECFGTFRAFVGGTHKHGQPPPFSELHKGNSPVAAQLVDRLKRRNPTACEGVHIESLRTRCIFGEAIPWCAASPSVHHELSAVVSSWRSSHEAHEELPPGSAYFPRSDDSVCCVRCHNQRSESGAAGGDPFCGSDGNDDDVRNWFIWRTLTLAGGTPQGAQVLRNGMAMKPGVLYERLFVDPRRK